MTKTKVMLGVLLATAALPAHAAQGDVLVRVRAILVAPNESSSGILPALPTEKVAVSNTVMPEVDFTYMATDHVGLELILATSKHKLSGQTGTTGRIGKLGSSWVLPPTLTAQYHFAPQAKVRPYVGAGVNYTVFWNEDASDGLEAAVGKTRIHLSDSLGWAVQAGTDIDLTKTVFLNLDVKYIGMKTNARLATTAIGTQRVKVDINPLVAGIGLGFRF